MWLSGLRVDFQDLADPELFLILMGMSLTCYTDDFRNEKSPCSFLFITGHELQCFNFLNVGLGLKIFVSSTKV